jgi:hypothetical protein
MYHFSTEGADAFSGKQGHAVEEAVMVQATQVSPSVRSTRIASPERWQHAAERAIVEGTEVRLVNASGMWVANSGSQANVAYLLEITGSIVQSCSCPAGSFGDPCCKHAARFYLDAGLLDPEDPEPDPLALGGTGDCSACHGCTVIYNKDLERARWLYPICPASQGSGIAPVPTAAPKPVSPAAAAA